MSITFAPERTAADVLGFRVHHSRGAGFDGAAVDGRLHSTHADAIATLVEHNESCPDALCRCDLGTIDAVMTFDAPEVNVSNMNAKLLLDALGLGDQDMWDMPALSAEDFRDRVIVAMSLSLVDEGMPAYASTAPGRATVIECGRRPGYLQDQLGRLLEVADSAAARNRAVLIG